MLLPTIERSASCLAWTTTSASPSCLRSCGGSSSSVCTPGRHRPPLTCLPHPPCQLHATFTCLSRPLARLLDRSSLLQPVSLGVQCFSIKTTANLMDRRPGHRTPWRRTCRWRRSRSRRASQGLCSLAMGHRYPARPPLLPPPRPTATHQNQGHTPPHRPSRSPPPLLPPLCRASHPSQACQPCQARHNRDPADGENTGLSRSCLRLWPLSALARPPALPSPSPDALLTGGRRNC
mmetsp:Transcript_23554/g.54970  ORF Transcript_23554/g.54970 Transcript_23554/m.54970 type:complete len:235 (+) Transcript_23554:1125-1829(+)